MTTTSYLALIRKQADFRHLWLGEVVSFFGDWFNTIALYAAVIELTSPGERGVALSLVMIAKTIPAFVIAPFSGPIIDRFDRRKLLLATDLLRLLGTGGLILAYHFSCLPGLYLVTVFMMLCAAFTLPTKNAVLPMILDRRDLPVANALSGGTWSIMLALGAAAGGFATAELGITAAFAIDGATFVLAALLFFPLPPLRPPGARATRRETGFLEGLRHLRRHPYILALVSLKPMMALAGGIFTLVPLYGKEVFEHARGDQYVGLLFSSRGVGAAVGALVVRLLIRDSELFMRRLIAIGFLTMGCSYALLALAPVFTVAMFALCIAHIGAACVWVFSGTLLQWRAERAFQGRLFSLEFGGHTLLLAITSGCTGLLLDSGVPIRTITLGCALTMVPAILLWCAALRGSRDILPRSSEVTP